MKNRKKLFIGLGLLAVIAVMVIVNLSKKSGNAVEVQAIEVKRGEIVSQVSGSGYIQPELDVEISARISAEIIDIHVEEGDSVKKGELLVELDRQRYEALAERAASGVKSAQASLKKNKADYDRILGLYEKNLKSQAELDAAEADMMMAESQLEQARAGLREANDNLAKTRLMSPINGTVTKLNKEEGEIAVGSEFQADPIMTVSDLSRMEVLAEIDENEVVLVSIGDTTKIDVDAITDTVFLGAVSEIAHTATTRGRGTQEQVTNFEVKIAVLDNADKLRPGMSSTVDINVERRSDILYIPIQCVTVRDVETDTTTSKKEEKEVVFVVNDAKAHMTVVNTGISDDTNIQIVNGLEEGQKVVSGSYKAISRDLEDETPVKVKDDSDKDGE